MKVLVVLAIVNTILFTASNLLGIAIWWVLGLEVVAYALWRGWKAWSHPVQQLVNQAAYMNWVAVGTTKDQDGFRDTLLGKDGVIARVSYQGRCVHLVEPFTAGPFKDFVEVDRFLQSPRPEADS